MRKLRLPGDAVIVERGVVRGIVLSCPCGCGEALPINLDSRAGPAWHLYRNGSSAITLFPSVWRESGCKSHFIVWRGRVYMVGRYDDDFDSADLSNEVERALINTIRETLPTGQLMSFATIAERLGAIPWDVLVICRQLVRVGAATEGRGDQLGQFGRLDGKSQISSR